MVMRLSNTKNRCLLTAISMTGDSMAVKNGSMSFWSDSGVSPWLLSLASTGIQPRMQFLRQTPTDIFMAWISGVCWSQSRLITLGRCCWWFLSKVSSSCWQICLSGSWVAWKSLCMSQAS
ncbi:hypothetical protein FGO68_gene8901 [Halteria grandinella]|uniref:Uncharacterized protein n=1 Tax=Halteria grandinella TaxID=5974 RepID=A0A8J8SV68_HALGN|nr:hypothetical protein FGO68_gene8901 [Halteria grandinella]